MAVCLLAASCAYVQAPSISTTPTTAKNEPYTTDSINNELSCNDAPYLLSVEPVQSFYWSFDSRYVIYESTDDRKSHIFDVSRFEEVNEETIQPQLMPEFVTVFEGDSNFPKQTSNLISVSPSREKAIYVREAIQKIGGSESIGGEGVSVENSVNNIYLLSANQEPILAGQTDGIIGQISWSELENFVSFDMLGEPAPIGAGQIWLLETGEPNLRVFIPSSDPVTNFMGFSPYESFALFSTRRNYYVKDVQSNLIFRIEIDSPKFVGWLEENLLVAIKRPKDNAEADSLIFYRIQPPEVIAQSNLGISLDPLSFPNALVSPNKFLLLMKEETTGSLYLLTLCY